MCGVTVIMMIVPFINFFHLVALILNIEVIYKGVLVDHN